MRDGTVRRPAVMHVKGSFFSAVKGHSSSARRSNEVRKHQRIAEVPQSKALGADRINEGNLLQGSRHSKPHCFVQGADGSECADCQHQT